MMRPFFLLALTACGRLGFDGLPRDDAGTGGERVVDATIGSDAVPRPCTGAAWCNEVSDVPDDLSKIWGTSATNIWAVGGGGAITRRTAGGWAEVNSDTGVNLTAISGSSAQDVWALGNGGGTYWNGTVWQERAAPTTPVGDVWVSAPNDAWAAGVDMWRWNGGTWTVVPTPAMQTLRGVWGASATDVFAVGDGGVIMRWNGTVWTKMTSNTSRGLNAIDGLGVNDIWAVGDSGVTVHFDGSVWTNVPPAAGSTLYAVTVAGPGEVWATGGANNLVHWNGSAWSVAMAGTPRFMQGLWSNSAEEIWMVGGMGTVQRGP